MTFAEMITGKIPEYYKGMGEDGYSNEAILFSLHRQMWREYQERQAQQNQTDSIKISSEVKIRK